MRKLGSTKERLIRVLEHAEEQARERAERVAEIIEDAPEGERLLEKDADYIIGQAGGAANQFGLAREELDRV